MFYGLWRYWAQAKKELLTLGCVFGLLFAFITLLTTIALNGTFNSVLNTGKQSVFAVGVQNEAGSLSHTSPYVSKALESIPNVKNRLLWTQDKNQVEILGEEENLNIVFTNYSYISMLKPRFLGSTQRYQCEPDCILVGAAVAAKFGRPESIKIGDNYYEVTAIFDEKNFEFPDGTQADVILDVSQFGIASSMHPIFTIISANFSDVSMSQIAEFMPVYRTLIEVSSLQDLPNLTTQIQETYENQKHLFTDIRRMISLLGSDDQKLGLIQGPFFDKKIKENTLLMQMLFLVAACQLFLVTLVNLISALTRFNLMRSYENTTRYALGGHKWHIFINNIYFIQPIMILATLAGAFCVGAIQISSSHIIKMHLSVTFPPLTRLYSVYIVLILIVAFCLPALINLKVFYSDFKAEKSTLTRKTILQIRSLNVVLFTLATISIFLANSTYSHWQTLKQRGTKNILQSAQMIALSHSGEGFVSPKWESVLSDIYRQVPNVGFLNTLPGDRNLSFKSLQFNDEYCQAKFNGWENRFYGNPFSVITGQDIQSKNWGSHDIAISKSILNICDFNANEVIGKYIQDTDRNKYQIKAVVDDILYDVHVGTPQQVIYIRELAFSNFRNLILPEYVDLNKLSADLEEDILEYNLQMVIKDKGSLIHFISRQLTREVTNMIISFSLMGLSLGALFLAFTQHLSKTLNLRNREWGTRRAMGENKRQLTRSLIFELSQEWRVSLLFSVLFTLLYSYLQPNLLSTPIFTIITSVLTSACVVFVGAAYYLVQTFNKAFRSTPASLLRSGS